MGTRSLTLVYDGEKNTIVNMYRQFDGYPSGHGQELAAFLAPIKMVNGIGFGINNERIANGANCLAAQIIAHFKNGPGGIYLHAPTDTDCGQDYEYHVYANTFKPEEGIRIVCVDGRQQIFSGTPAEFLEFCEED